MPYHVHSQNSLISLTFTAFLYFVFINFGAPFAVISPCIRCKHHTTKTIVPPSSGSIWLAMKQTDNSDNQRYSAEQIEINERIYAVASTICNVQPEQLNVEWKPTRIVVTLKVDQAYIDATVEDDDIFLSENNSFVDEDDFVETEEVVDPVIVCDETDDDSLEYDLDFATDNNISEEIKASNGIDLSLLARSINAALDDGRIGSQITERFEIEVTTPGASDELTTPIMFAAYRGFDVLVHHQDPKTKKMKTFEGRLVERTSEFVVLNVKGRMKHLKNSDILSVKLPKAKKEKGVR